MKLPIGYTGKVEAKAIKIYHEPFILSDALDRFENKFSEIYNVVVSDNIYYGGLKLTLIT